MSEFAYEHNAWNQRAQVAGDAGEKLEGLSRAISQLMASNYLGDGCEEGEILFARLKGLLSDASQELRSSAIAARRLSAKSSVASNTLVVADGSAAAEFREPAGRN